MMEALMRYRLTMFYALVGPIGPIRREVTPAKIVCIHNVKIFIQYFSLLLHPSSHPARMRRKFGQNLNQFYKSWASTILFIKCNVQVLNERIQTIVRVSLPIGRFSKRFRVYSCNYQKAYG